MSLSTHLHEVSLHGTVRRVVYRADNGYTVARLACESSATSEVVITAPGCLALVRPGERLSVVGRWEQHPRFGPRLHVVSKVESEGETTRAEVLELLSGPHIKGVGPKLAQSLLNAFGDRTLEVLQAEGGEAEEQLLKLPGVGRKTLVRIRESVRRWAANREWLEFGKSLGLSEAQAYSLHRKLGDRVEAMVRADPYLLVSELPQLGFCAIDALALQRLELRADAPVRARALVRRVMDEALRQGHCWVDASTLAEEASRAMLGPQLPAGRALECVRRQLREMRKKGELPTPAAPRRGIAEEATAEAVSTARLHFLPDVYAAEERIAIAVRRRTRRFGAANAADGGGAPDGGGTPAAGAALGGLSPTQREAVEAALRERLLVLTGGPGTGKTFAVKRVVEGWRREGKRVLLACPTARAAMVLAAAVGRPAATIHRLLEYNPQEDVFKRNRLAPLEADAIVVDEASMLDVFLAARLLDALPDAASVLLVGDADQLPSVGPGAVLFDLLRAARVPRVELRTVFRQDPSGDIARNAQLINHGEAPAHLARRPGQLVRDAPVGRRAGGCLFVPAADEAAAAAIISGDGLLGWLRDVAGYDLRDELQVLAPVKNGPAGTASLNRLLKQQLNPGGVGAAAGSTRGAPSVEAQAGVSVGDSVIQLTNDYDHLVFNGDVGRVSAVAVDGRRFTVRFESRGTLTYGHAALGDEARAAVLPADDDGVKVEYPRGALGRDVSLAYALTVHKAQGSEYPVVVLPVLPQHGLMLYRNLLYTAISRAKELLVLVGCEAAITTAVQNDQRQRRRTLLMERIDDDDVAPFCVRHE